MPFLWVSREATPEDTGVPEKAIPDCAGKGRDDGLDGSWVLTRLAPDCIHVGLVTDASRDGTWVSTGLVPFTVPDDTWVLTGETLG